MPDQMEKYLAQVDGIDSLESEQVPHPLVCFVELDTNPRPPRWVLPGVIGHGLTLISGAQNVGKTTATLPLALMAAGLHGGEMAPQHWRHVVYVTEDVEQANRIVVGMVRFGGLDIKIPDVRERFHLVKAVRMDAAKVVQVGGTYREQLTRVVDNVQILPLVVFDTKSAIFAMDNENDNAEASRMVAAIKQDFADLPVWLVGHVSKQNIGRSNLSELSTRGANAIEADANQTMFLVIDDGQRYLVQGKTRFEPRWRELEVNSHTATVMATNEFGLDEDLILRWSITTPAPADRRQANQTALEQAKRETEAAKVQEARAKVLDAVNDAWSKGSPTSRTGLRDLVPGKTSYLTSLVETLVLENWLYEIEIPVAERSHPKKSRYLVALTDDEREIYELTGEIPAAKLVVPASWKRAVSCVPRKTSGSAKNEVSIA